MPLQLYHHVIIGPIVFSKEVSRLKNPYTNQVQHFGNTSTSRAESQNARLKAVFVSSIGK